MIKINDSNQKIKLVAISKENASEFVIKEVGKATFISDEKTIFVILEKEKNVKKTLMNFFSDFVKTNKYNLDVDLDSFIKFSDDSINKEQIINLIYELISFEIFEKVNLKTDSKKNEVIYNLISKDFNNINELIKKEEIKMEFVNYARFLQDTPPNIGHSDWYADEIVKKAKEIGNIKITVIDKKEAEKLNMGLFLAVNAGSNHECKAVCLEYIGDESKTKIGLVGKGITFDSGGYNLKSSDYMMGMKYDMSGAAIMLSTVMALAKAKAKVNVSAIGLFTDNRIGKNATLPQSVIKSMNGTTVEIDNTDAEGRLVLADGITYLLKEKKVDEIFEASTLTGSCVIALGGYATGVFTTNDKKWEQVSEFSSYTGEKLWRMPIFEEHLEICKKEAVIGDISNAPSGREAGSSTAAAFLNYFADKKPFVHFDVAGTAYKNNRGKGILVKTLFEMLNK